MKCQNCDKTLQKIDDFETDYQFENALWINFSGGYGMFVESNPYNNNENPPQHFKETDYESVICHDCAHGLCDTVPWISKILKPLLSHSHTQEFWDNNPEHDGWDKP